MHLTQAPSRADYQTRLARREEIAAAMRAVHEIVWRHVADVTTRILQPSRAPDDRLNNPCSGAARPSA